MTARTASEGPRRAAKSSEVQERVLAVAARLFTERGFHAVSIRDIARECDVSVSTVLYHGGSKQGLLELILAQTASQSSPLVTFLHHIGEPVVNTREEFFAVYDQFVELLVNAATTFPENRRLWLRLLFDHPEQFTQLERDYVWPLLDRGLRFLRDVAARGLIKGDEKHLRYFIASIDWMMDGFFAAGLLSESGMRSGPESPHTTAEFLTYLKSYGRAVL